MADSSPAFNPPVTRLIESDPSIIKVPMTETDMGFRASQTPKDGVSAPGMKVANLKNGQ